ncbi:MAG: hypothetical protein KDK27_20160 [Leptospiraceae bacterium]|nr:hypothetical protein [Leptospiraceae bacterium]
MIGLFVVAGAGNTDVTNFSGMERIMTALASGGNGQYASDSTHDGVDAAMRSDAALHRFSAGDPVSDSVMHR